MTKPAERQQDMPEPRLTIWVSNKVTRGKAAAAAVHAALTHYGIGHGAVIVLGANPGAIERECTSVIRDVGRTEVDPGTVTAGVRSVEPEQPSKHTCWWCVTGEQRRALYPPLPPGCTKCARCGAVIYTGRADDPLNEAMDVCTKCHEEMDL